MHTLVVKRSHIETKIIISEQTEAASSICDLLRRRIHLLLAKLHKSGGTRPSQINRWRTNSTHASSDPYFCSVLCYTESKSKQKCAYKTDRHWDITTPIKKYATQTEDRLEFANYAPTRDNLCFGAHASLQQNHDTLFSFKVSHECTRDDDKHTSILCQRAEHIAKSCMTHKNDAIHA